MYVYIYMYTYIYYTNKYICNIYMKQSKSIYILSLCE